MTLPRVRLRGGFQRPIGLGEFVRRFLSGQIEAPVLDPDTRSIIESVRIDPHRGAPPQDIWRAYKDFLFAAWGQELMERWRREGREIPTDPDAQEALQRIARARIPQRRTSMHLPSFYRYFHMLRSLGWVEPTGEEEGSLLGGEPGAPVERVDGSATLVVPQPRRYFRLTRVGLAEPPAGAWRNPLLVLYPERGQEYYRATAEAARRRRGKLPPYRKPKPPEVEAPPTPAPAPPPPAPRPRRRPPPAPPPPPPPTEEEEEVGVSEAVQERWDALLVRIRGWPTPRPGDADRLLKQFAEKEGVAPMDDALALLQEYRAIARPDFESAEEFQEARADAWQEFLDALDEVELEVA